MQNEIYDEKNGLTYMLCGDYYLPKLALTDIEPTYGKYGMLRKSYLQEHRKAKYQILLLQGKLVEHEHPWGIMIRYSVNEQKMNSRL